MTVLENIRMIGTEFASVSDERIEQWIEFCDMYVSKEKFGKWYERALALVVCHRMKVSGEGDNTFGEYSRMGLEASRSRIASISEGGSSISFSGNQNAQGDMVVNDYAQTLYGTQFLALIKLVVIPITI